MSLDYTIAICTWNRADMLAITLEQVSQLRVPSGVTCETIVCDNNSTDDTKAVIEAAMKQHFAGRRTLRYVFEPEQGLSNARNRLVAEAKGEWLLFLDDDLKVDANLIETYHAAIRRYPDAVMFGGSILPWFERPSRGRRRLVQELYPGPFGIFRVDRDEPMVNPEPTARGANMMYRLRVLGPRPFDPRRGVVGKTWAAGEETTLIRHLLSQGHRGHLIADANVHHFIPHHKSGVIWFVKWQMGFGRSWVVDRGRATPGRFGVPWWAWKEFARRVLRAAVRWRPWPSPAFYDALKDAAQYYGYLRASR